MYDFPDLTLRLIYHYIFKILPFLSILVVVNILSYNARARSFRYQKWPRLSQPF